MAEPLVLPHDISWTDVHSSLVRRVGYQLGEGAHDGWLYVELQPDPEREPWLYRYHGPDAQVYARLIKAPSVGRAFNELVRDAYPFERLSPPPRGGDSAHEWLQLRGRSSWIEAVAFEGDSDDGSLFVRMHPEGYDVRSYRYDHVPQALYEQLLAAESVGSFFNAVIRNHYPAERLTEQT